MIQQTNNQENDFIDPDKDMLREVNSMKELLLRHMAKISELSTKEFRSGYYETVGYNPSRKIYHSDSRESYINAVNFLYDILYPKFDDTMREADKQIQEEQEEELKKLLDESSKTPESKVQIIYSRKTFRELNLLIERIKLFDSTGGQE